MSISPSNRPSRRRKLSRGAAFVEALTASVALAGIVAAGLFLFRKWERAASHFDERARTFASAFAGCGRTRDLSAEAALAWRRFEPRAFVNIEPPPRVVAASNAESHAGQRRESIACNERAVLLADELTRLRRDIEGRVLGRSK